MPGRYTFPAHVGIPGPGPGLDVIGGVSPCDGAGSFDVLEAVYGPAGESLRDGFLSILDRAATLLDVPEPSKAQAFRNCATRIRSMPLPADSK